MRGGGEKKGGRRLSREIREKRKKRKGFQSGKGKSAKGKSYLILLPSFIHMYAERFGGGGKKRGEGEMRKKRGSGDHSYSISRSGEGRGGGKKKRGRIGKSWNSILDRILQKRGGGGEKKKGPEREGRKT